MEDAQGHTRSARTGTRIGGAGIRSGAGYSSGSEFQPCQSGESPRPNRNPSSPQVGADVRHMDSSVSRPGLISGISQSARQCFDQRLRSPGTAAFMGSTRPTISQQASRHAGTRGGMDVDMALADLAADGIQRMSFSVRHASGASPYLQPPKSSHSSRSHARRTGMRNDDDRGGSTRPSTVSSSNDQVRHTKLLQTYGGASPIPSRSVQTASFQEFRDPGRGRDTALPHQEQPRAAAAGERNPAASTRYEVEVGSGGGDATRHGRPESAAGGGRPQSGLRGHVELLESWGQGASHRPESAAGRPQSGVRHSPEAPAAATVARPASGTSWVHGASHRPDSAAGRPQSGVRHCMEAPAQAATARPASGTSSSRPMSARPGSARGGVSQPPSFVPSSSLSRESLAFGIQDVSDDDRIEGEEPLLDSHSGPQACTRLVTSYGMTLDQYMSRMVTTPASAAATSGLGIGSSNETSPTGLDHRGPVMSLQGKQQLSEDAPYRHGQAADFGRHASASTRPHSSNVGSPSCRKNPSTPNSVGSPASSWFEPAAHTSGYSGHKRIASASIALSNSLDLRPATAAAPDMMAGVMHGGGSQQHRYGASMHVDVGDHGDLIKETDLGGMSASLFTPNAGKTRAGAAQPPSPGDSGALASTRLSCTGSQGEPSPSRLDSLVAAINASAADAAPSVRSLPSGAQGSASGAAGLAGEHGMHLGGRPTGHSAVEDWEEEMVVTGGPPLRTVQSARPVTRGAQELDASVWQNNIASQLERPPSRQKPPNEALHLWAPGEVLSSMQDAMQLGPHSRARARPQTAAASTYRGKAGPSMQAHAGLPLHGITRPPARQKPPPVSLGLDSNGFRSDEMRRPMEPTSEGDDYEMSESDNSDI